MAELDLFLSAFVSCNGGLSRLGEGEWSLAYSKREPGERGAPQERNVYAHAGTGLRAALVSESYPDSPVVRQWLEVENAGNEPVRLERVDSLSFTADLHGWELLSFTSGWGLEYESERFTLAADSELILETRAGRCSRDRHPWASFSDGESRITLAVAWSGNWAIRFQPEGEQVTVSAGLNDWEFEKELQPGESMITPAVVMVVSGDDLNAASQALARWGRDYLYPRNVLARALPVEWNHWFPYFDEAINEEVVRANTDVAAEMGIEAVLLDAGWFGAPGASWYKQRGDWRTVNRERFPSGIRALSDYVHAKGLKFGIWCEIEAVGEEAALNEERPDLIAAREGKSLGCICLGNPEARQWAYEVLAHLIEDYRVDWIKLDFNLDPGAGCDRIEHGHGAKEGLYAHYQGYYRLLDRVRQDYPQVLLEGCSSGGLRIDLGLLEHLHVVFLSDPDWPVHGLQISWGATTMLAPNVCLHWPWSEWRSLQERVPQQTFDPRSPALTQTALDYYTRISMLNWFGFSLNLPGLPRWVKDRLTYHTRIYQTRVRRFVREADLFRLSEQPLRAGGGDRWQGFLYVMPGKQEAMLMAFRLSGSEEECIFKLAGLEPERVYTIEDEDSGAILRASGEKLMERGVTLSGLPEEGSAILYLS